MSGVLHRNSCEHGVPPFGSCFECQCAVGQHLRAENDRRIREIADTLPADLDADERQRRAEIAVFGCPRSEIG